MRDTRTRSRLFPGARATSRSAAATSGTENASSVAIRRIGFAAGFTGDSFRQVFDWPAGETYHTIEKLAAPLGRSPVSADFEITLFTINLFEGRIPRGVA